MLDRLDKTDISRPSTTLDDLSLPYDWWVSYFSAGRRYNLLIVEKETDNRHTESCSNENVFEGKSDMKKVFIIIALIPCVLYCQGNEIPYNSKDNSLALTVENTAVISARNVFVEIQNPPSWLKLESQKIMLKDIPAKQSKDAEFRFSVEKTAPVGKEQKMSVLIKTTDGQMWTKEIAFTVGAPKEFRLYDNFH